MTRTVGDRRERDRATLMKEVIKVKKVSLNIYLIIVALFTSSCSSAASTVQPASTAANPVQSATAPLTPTSTSSPVPTTTPTIEATLESMATRETIAAYIDKGENCETPCFLGIYPGKTTLREMTGILTHLGLPISKISDKGVDYYGIDYELDNRLSMNVTFIVQDQQVKNVKMDISMDTSEVSDARNWPAFSPETLIDRYGTPSEVTLATDWGPRSYFEMNIYFASVDLIVEYNGYNLISRPSNSMVICPLRTPFEYLRIWMGKDPQYPPMEAVSFEKATSLTMEDFAELMTGDPDQACFTMNEEVIPKLRENP
ncbi:hypothetical protein LARV_03903 [Longilinea arvoryzae]|uniref:Uncharacterized protein n=1 Tax=Longilinea arvoryzae TaxID=360412 RepID=A0A0K8MZN2_9CHLR|nr:hypothetical protein [Longilinea arvoryzae]GAP16107.1 hypothetical protein LARV_03903 [Longilinea arvoryzae]